MVESRLRWLSHVRRRLVEILLRTVDQIESSLIVRGRWRLEKKAID